MTKKAMLHRFIERKKKDLVIMIKSGWAISCYRSILNIFMVDVICCKIKLLKLLTLCDFHCFRVRIIIPNQLVILPSIRMCLAPLNYYNIFLWKYEFHASVSHSRNTQYPSPISFKSHEKQTKLDSDKRID